MSVLVLSADSVRVGHHAQGYRSRRNGGKDARVDEVYPLQSVWPAEDVRLTSLWGPAHRKRAAKVEALARLRYLQHREHRHRSEAQAAAADLAHHPAHDPVWARVLDLVEA